ncbi:uncharacterized protein LOC112652600 isoform X2 [Canis lupus dingo]|nr:uncharacterized protein LOC112652600 isoform X2 [Canis lupus dingo]
MFLSQAQGEWNIQQRTLPAGPCCEMTVGKKSPVVFSAGKGSLLLILEDCETHLEDSLASDVMDTVDGEELDVYFHGVSGALELLRWTPRLSKDGTYQGMIKRASLQCKYGDDRLKVPHETASLLPEREALPGLMNMWWVWGFWMNNMVLKLAVTPKGHYMILLLLLVTSENIPQLPSTATYERDFLYPF